MNSNKPGFHYRFFYVLDVVDKQQPVFIQAGHFDHQHRLPIDVLQLFYEFGCTWPFHPPLNQAKSQNCRDVGITNAGRKSILSCPLMIGFELV